MKNQVSPELKAQTLHLRRNHTLSQVSSITKLPLGTVKTLCRRSGVFTDNLKHRELFKLPPIKQSTSTALTVPELPLQDTITGDKEIDAVLWLRQVIGTGKADFISKAMEAAKHIKTDFKELEKRYLNLLVSSNPNNWAAGFSSLGFADLEGLAMKSIKQSALRSEAFARFGENPFILTPAEQFCEEAMNGLKESGTFYEFDADEVNERFNAYPSFLPQTLSDCLYEAKFWDDLYWLRAACGGCDSTSIVNARTIYIFRKLKDISPRSKQEAITVLRYMAENNYMDRRETEDILLNLIGS